MFIVYTLINGLVQGIASIIELSFFIIFYIDKITALKYQLKGYFSVSQKRIMKDEHIFEKYNFKTIQRCISTRGSNTRRTC